MSIIITNYNYQELIKFIFCGIVLIYFKIGIIFKGNI